MLYPLWAIMAGIACPKYVYSKNKNVSIAKDHPIVLLVASRINTIVTIPIPITKLPKGFPAFIAKNS